MVIPKSYCFIAHMLTLKKWYSQTRYAQILNLIKMDRAIKCDSGIYVGHLILRKGSFTFLSAKMRGSQWLQSFCSFLSLLSALLSTEILLGLTCTSYKLWECWLKRSFNLWPYCATLLITLAMFGYCSQAPFLPTALTIHLAPFSTPSCHGAAAGTLKFWKVH